MAYSGTSSSSNLQSTGKLDCRDEIPRSCNIFNFVAARLKKVEEERDEAKLERDAAKLKLEAAELERANLKKKRDTNYASFDKADLARADEEVNRLSASFDIANNVYLECLKSVNNCKQRRRFWLFCDF